MCARAIELIADLTAALHAGQELSSGALRLQLSLRPAQRLLYRSNPRRSRRNLSDRILGSQQAQLQDRARDPLRIAFVHLSRTRRGLRRVSIAKTTSRELVVGPATRAFTRFTALLSSLPCTHSSQHCAWACRARSACRSAKSPGSIESPAIRLRGLWAPGHAVWCRLPINRPPSARRAFCPPMVARWPRYHRTHRMR